MKTWRRWRSSACSLYSTAGKKRPELAHHGNLLNAADLRRDLLKRGVGLTSTSDSEVLTMMLAGAEGDTWDKRIQNVMSRWTGAYSLVVLTLQGVFAVRDPW